mgnify:FL=1
MGAEQDLADVCCDIVEQVVLRSMRGIKGPEVAKLSVESKNTICSCLAALEVACEREDFLPKSLAASFRVVSAIVGCGAAEVSQLKDAIGKVDDEAAGHEGGAMPHAWSSAR